MFVNYLRTASRFSTIATNLNAAITDSLKPTKLEITNESHRHSRGTDTHFNVLIVSEKFKNLSKVQQHQLVYSSLGPLMKEIHALTLTCYS